MEHTYTLRIFISLTWSDGRYKKSSSCFQFEFRLKIELRKERESIFKKNKQQVCNLATLIARHKMPKGCTAITSIRAVMFRKVNYIRLNMFGYSNPNP